MDILGLKTKVIMLVAGIVLVSSLASVAYLKYQNLKLEKECSNLTTEITKLENENELLANSLKISNNTLEVRNEAIQGLEEKITILSTSKNGEVDVWKKKYQYCIKQKNPSQNGTGVMSNETSDFYTDLYNNNIFTD